MKGSESISIFIDHCHLGILLEINVKVMEVNRIVIGQGWRYQPPLF